MLSSRALFEDAFAATTGHAVSERPRRRSPTRARGRASRLLVLSKGKARFEGSSPFVCGN